MSAGRRFRAPTLASALLLTLAACSQTFDAATLGVPVSMAPPADTAGAVAFRSSAKSVHLLFGLFTISQASLQKALARQLVGGLQVSRVKITSKSRWIDVLLTGITLGVVVPRTVIFEGVVSGAPAASP
jgi:hypothetical protein